MMDIITTAIDTDEKVTVTIKNMLMALEKVWLETFILENMSCISEFPKTLSYFMLMARQSSTMLHICENIQFVQYCQVYL